jgi:hypothetical protein
LAKLPAAEAAAAAKGLAPAIRLAHALGLKTLEMDTR